MLNYSIEKFKSLHKSKNNVILFYSISSDGKNEIPNLIDNFLIEKNSFIFESVEKGTIKGRYTIFDGTENMHASDKPFDCSLFLHSDWPQRRSSELGRWCIYSTPEGG